MIFYLFYRWIQQTIVRQERVTNPYEGRLERLLACRRAAETSGPSTVSMGKTSTCGSPPFPPPPPLRVKSLSLQQERNMLIVDRPVI